MLSKLEKELLINSVFREILGNLVISAPAQNALGTVERRTITFTVVDKFSCYIAANISFSS